MKILLILFVGTLTCFSSCQPDLDLFPKEETGKLVVWCILHPDSIASAYVSRTSAPLSKDIDRRIENAHVLLFENNILTDTLFDSKNGFYQSRTNFKPKEGKNYFLKIAKSGFETIETLVDTMPQKLIIRKFDINDSIRPLADGKVLAKITMTMNPASHFPNYGINKVLLKKQGRIELTNAWLGVYGACFEQIFGFLDKYLFQESECIDFKEKYEVSIADFRKQELKESTAIFSMCAITNQTAQFYKKLNDLKFDYTGFYNSVDAFWSPVYLPPSVKNGFGFLGCYNTREVEIQF